MSGSATPTKHNYKGGTLRERQYLTNCSILTNISTEKSYTERQLFLTTWRKRVKNGDSTSKTFNKFLDSLAFLLVSRPGRDCIAVALTELTRDKIHMLATVSDEDTSEHTSEDIAPLRTKPWKVAATANYKRHCGREEGIEDHAKFIFGTLSRHHKEPSDVERHKIRREFRIDQVQYSILKIIESWRRWKILVEPILVLPGSQMRGPELFEAEENEKNFFIDRLPLEKVRDEDMSLQRRLAGLASTTALDASNKVREILNSEGLQDLKRIDNGNFCIWHEFFVILFKEITNKIERAKVALKANGTITRELARNIEYLLSLLGVAAVHSAVFRTWLCAVTKLAAKLEAERLSPQADNLPEHLPSSPQMSRNLTSGNPTERVLSPIGCDRNSDQLNEGYGGKAAGMSDPLEENVDDTSNPLNRDDNDNGSDGDSDYDDDSDDDESVAGAASLGLQTKNKIFLKCLLLKKHITHAQQIFGVPRIVKEAATRSFSLDLVRHNRKKTYEYRGEKLERSLNRLLQSKGPSSTNLSERVETFLRAFPELITDRKRREYLVSALNSDSPTIAVSEHAELILLAELRKINRDSAYQYIGISKPPCFACEVVLSYDEDIEIRHGHGHVYISQIPQDISAHLRGFAFDAVEEVTKKVVTDVYRQKHRRSEDSDVHPGYLSHDNVDDYDL